MIKPDSKFDSIKINKDGTLHFLVKNVAGVYEELKVVYILVDQCLKYLDNKPEEKIGFMTNGQFILETRLLNRPDPRFGHLITLLNERILKDRGKVIGTSWEYMRPINDPEITPLISNR